MKSDKLGLIYEGVVIGSHTIDERRFQVLNFMNMLYNCIIKDNDYSYLGYSNIGVYTHNLIYELTELEKLDPHKYNNLNKIYEKIRSIETILRLLNKNDSKNYKKYIKDHCTRIWEDILHDITRIYKLKYKYNDIKY